MRILGVVQARMGSGRLPGKVLRPLAGRTALGRLVRAVGESGAVDDLVVATTAEPADDAIVAECERLGVAWHRGATEDVLARFLGALEARPADAVMRFTADCPLLDPEIVALVARVFRSVPGLDYVNTSIARTLPRGMDAEIIRASTLRAHVTSYVYTYAERFRVLGLTVPPDRAHLRLTLDTEQDWRLISAVVEQFGDSTVSLAKLAEWLEANPRVRDLNAAVAQKTLEQA